MFIQSSNQEKMLIRYKDGLRSAREKITSLEKDKESLTTEIQQLKSEETDNGEKVRTHNSNEYTCRLFPYVICIK